MFPGPPTWLRDRPPGVSSRLHRGDGAPTAWRSESGVSVDLPLTLDILEMDASSHRLLWWVMAEIGLHNNTPVVTNVAMGAEDGLDLVRLQREFRWYTPLDVVTRIAPRLIARGQDPYTWEFPVTGYPEASIAEHTEGRRLSNEFLEDIAREYLEHGRGYVKEMAAAHQVSPSTIASWVHKARTRGIISDTSRGVKGGAWVKREDRKPG